MRDFELGLGQRVLRAQHVDLRNRAGLEAAFVAIDFARRGLAIDRGLVEGLLRGQLLLPVVDAGALDVDAQAVERRLFLLELVVQFRTVDFGQHLVLLDLVAGVHVERDGAGGGRIQRRAHRGDDLALRGDVARQRAALDRRRCARSRMLTDAPGRNQTRHRRHDPDQGDEHGGADRADDDPALARGDSRLRCGGPGRRCRESSVVFSGCSSAKSH